MRTRFCPLFVHHQTSSRGNIIRRPMVTNVCCNPDCGKTVDVRDQSTYSPQRVNGDSANGYEPLCRECITALEQEWATLPLDLV